MSRPEELVRRLKIDRDPDPPTHGRRPYWLVIAISICVLLAIAGWWLLGSGSADTVITVTTEQVKAINTNANDVVLEASGYVAARRRATVSAKTTGRLAEVLVEEGMEVSAGQVVARLDDSLERAQLEVSESLLTAARHGLAETEIRLLEARRQLSRIQGLIEHGVASDAELDTAEAEVQSLEARLELGTIEVRVADKQLAFERQVLADSVITAPFAGIVTSQAAQVGEMVSPVSAGGGYTRTGICTVVDLSSLEIEVDVSERNINRITTGQAALATLDAYPEWKIPARVITTVPAADRVKATVRVRVALLERDARILPDMGVRVVFLEEDEESDRSGERPESGALMVSEAALRREDNQDVVYVVINSTVERRPVQVGRRADGKAEIITGLKPGEMIVIEGPSDLIDGNRVQER